MFREKRRLISAASPRAIFPLAEGVGVFIGIIAWDLLTEGRMDIFKALLIAAPVSLTWFAVRFWIARSVNKQHQ